MCRFRYIALILIMMAPATAAFAQTPDWGHITRLLQKLDDKTDTIEVELEQTPRYESVYDSLMECAPEYDQMMSYKPLPNYFFRPAVFTYYNLPIADDKKANVFAFDYSGDSIYRWVEDELSLDRRMRRIEQRFFIDHPDLTKYNIRTLPLPPKQYIAMVNPADNTIELVEKPFNADGTQLVAETKGKIHWLKTAGASLQFSQAYVSPNWYQGGNNNLNMLLNLNYNVKLNQKLHPTLLFETNIQYKLALNNAPDDSIRNYNITEDLFQINSTFGIKAVKKWYYTINAQFKTQLLNSYTSNTRTLRSAFLSPGELNAGIGMTFNTANKKKTFSLDASISPLSYNLMICVDNRVNKGAYNIEPDSKTVSKYGSSMEFKMGWTIADNIKLTSRLFGFTDYHRAYADFENTLVFEINKFLTTQVFAHLRYDTMTPKVDPNWHKLQIKEIISLGFAYKFSTI